MCLGPAAATTSTGAGDTPAAWAGRTPPADDGVATIPSCSTASARRCLCHACRASEAPAVASRTPWDDCSS